MDFIGSAGSRFIIYQLYYKPTNIFYIEKTTLFMFMSSLNQYRGQ